MAFAVFTAAAAIGLVCMKLPKWILYEVWMYWNRLLFVSERGGQIGWNMWYRLMLVRVLIPETVFLILIKKRKKSALKFLFLLDLQASSLLAALSFAAAGLKRIYSILMVYMIYNVSYLSALAFCIWICECHIIGRKSLQKKFLPYLSGLILLAGLVMESLLLI